MCEKIEKKTQLSEYALSLHLPSIIKDYWMNIQAKITNALLRNQ